MARVRKGEITFYNLDGDEIEKELKTIAVIPLQFSFEYLLRFL